MRASLAIALAALLGGCAAGGGEGNDSMPCGGRACRDGGSGSGSSGGGSSGGGWTDTRPDAWGSSGGGWTIPDGGTSTLGDAGSGGGTYPDARPYSSPDASSGGGSTAGCGGETYSGRCDGNTVVWCENNAIQRDTCMTGYMCGYSSTLGYYACIATGGGGSCGSVTFVGHCTSTTSVEWCESGSLQSLTCASGYHCGYNGDAGFYACVP